MSKTRSPIEIANALTPHWMRKIKEFDALEIHPCAVVGRGDDGTEFIEASEPGEADFWTVYGHYCTGGVDAFEDFSTEAQALAFRDRLLAAYPHLAK